LAGGSDRFAAVKDGCGIGGAGDGGLNSCSSL
jgi:hypothetical protein